MSTSWRSGWTKKTFSGETADGPNSSSSPSSSPTNHNGSSGHSSQHELIMRNQIIPHVTKLAKEMRGRKTKEVHAHLMRALEALKTFQNEEWPPPQPNNGNSSVQQETADHDQQQQSPSRGGDESTITSTTEESATDDDDGTINNNDDQKDENTKRNDDDDDVDEQEGKAQEEKKKSLEDQQQEESAGASVVSNDSLESAVVPKSTTADAATVENTTTTRPPMMHTSIVTTCEALCFALDSSGKTIKSCELALEAVQIIVNARIYVSGQAFGRKGDQSLLRAIVESCSKCSEFSNSESLQTQLLKTLRTIMISPVCGVHETSMLTALRSTFHVYLVTKSTNCKNAAKAALVDMLRSVFTRMEAFDVVAAAEGSASAGENSEEEGRRLLPAASSETIESNNEPETPTSADKTSSQERKQSTFVSQYHTDSYYLFRSLCKMSSKETALDDQGEEALNINAAAKFFAISTDSSTDPASINSKILSLELILASVDLAGPAFCRDEKFVYLVQHYLCQSLLKNCVSNHTQVAFLSQKIFLVLVYKFKGHLKQEIQVFLSNIFVRVLESPNSSFKQKAVVIESLRSLCSDPAMLTQIFLNYDCDISAKNLYKDDIVHMLTKLAGKVTIMPLSANTASAQKELDQEMELSRAGMEVLVTILKAFLKALGFQDSKEGDEFSGDSASSRIRGMLQLNVVMPVATPADDDDSQNVPKVSAEADIACEEDKGNRENNRVVPGPEDDVAVKIVDAFELKRTQETNFEMGAVKFTLSLKRGTEFFIQNGFVERDARAVALFFLDNKEKLDKTQMGEALGKEPDASFGKNYDDKDAEKGGPGFWVRILHHYTDALDFEGLVFDDAIRLFLSGFRLPGEAQKIDRIMEKFAERYTSQNPDIFPTADTAFILAFSVIMLNTDLHNPSIKPERRMTVEGFLRNNRGIGEGGSDLPEDFLVGIFDRIKKNPFSLKEDDAARERQTVQEAVSFFESGSFFGQSSDERKRERFKKERDEMMAATQQLMRIRPDKNNQNTKIASADISAADDTRRLTEVIPPAAVVKPMFDVTWGPMLGILSQVLECSDDDRSVAVCLAGFVYAIRLAAHSSMSLARDTFVSSLAKFTYLGSVKEMKRKNVESIRTLLSIAISDGEYLGESWGAVLKCISQLARLRLTAKGLQTDESFLTPAAGAPATTESASGTSTANMPSVFRQQSKSEMAREAALLAAESNGRAVLEAVQEVLIDKVFSSTVSLSATSLAHFLEQLIAVSQAEIEGQSDSGSALRSTTAGSTEKTDSPIPSTSKRGGPSIFSLQRLVEVADYNMDVRPRLVWAQAWDVIGDFLTKIACHDAAGVRFFAIHALKQLSFKFLEKPELAEFHFQRVFLKPFLVVFDHDQSEDVRELVLQCMDNLVKTKSHNLRSGWKIVFAIITKSATDQSEKMNALGLSILQLLLDEHLHQLCNLQDGRLQEKEVIEDGKEEVVDSATSLNPKEELTLIQKSNRNANVDDFCDLCRASLSFILKYDNDQDMYKSSTIHPDGLAMRAFCHIAIYADLLAEKQVLPPITGAQCEDASAAGFTYSGLSEQDALEMVLWRPLLEGLAAAMRSNSRSSVDGVGCLVQRRSVLTIRAILIRHGNLFSNEQWVAILEQTLLPAMQTAVENDRSPVVRITSESPAVSNIDFLVDALPLPPQPNDVSLLGFEALTVARPGSRSLGKSELMLEASFTDLRHGGDGDLRKAYILAKKAATGRKNISINNQAEQPFPNSWLATIAPIAAGLLTDIASEIILPRGERGLTLLWPVIAAHFKLWCLGHRHNDCSTVPAAARQHHQQLSWMPCEALVRVACREVERFSRRLDRKNHAWVSAIMELYSQMLCDSAKVEKAIQNDLIRSRQALIVDHKNSDESNASEPQSEQKINSSSCQNKSEVNGVNGSGVDINGVPSIANGSVPALKIRCIAAHCMQQSLLVLLDGFALSTSEDTVIALMKALEGSRTYSESAVKDEDLSIAFQEALLNDWGDGVSVVDQTHGSAMFFLTQEASATRSMIRLLSILYRSNIGCEADGVDSWCRETFAEQPLFKILDNVFEKFLESEEKDSILIDPAVWRNACENQKGGKFALYCTSLAVVVADILIMIKLITPQQFSRHKKTFFTAMTKLIGVQSQEIRCLVQDILVKHIAPLLGEDNITG